MVGVGKKKVVRRLAVRQARVRTPARHPREDLYWAEEQWGNKSILSANGCMNECTGRRNIKINRNQFKTLNFCYLKSLHVHVRGSRAEWRAVRERRITRALPQTRVIHVCAGTCAEYQIRTYMGNLHSRNATHTCCPCLRRYLRRIPN
jgi:hypothetical protein